MGHVVCYLEKTSFLAACKKGYISKVRKRPAPLSSNVAKALYPDLVSLLEAAFIEDQQPPLRLAVLMKQTLKVHIESAAHLLRSQLNSPFAEYLCILFNSGGEQDDMLVADNATDLPQDGLPKILPDVAPEAFAPEDMLGMEFDRLRLGKMARLYRVEFIGPVKGLSFENGGTRKYKEPVCGFIGVPGLIQVE